jgi:ribose-phosphate pyrophosphokinase
VREKLVLAGPASYDLAKAVAGKLSLSLLKAEFTVFPDGETKFTADGKVSARTVYFVQSTHQPVDQHLFQLLLASHALSQEGARVIAVVPYLAYARQDKQFLPGESVTLGVVAHIMRSAGVVRLATVDIHSAEGLSLFSFPAYSVSAIPALVGYVKENLDLRNPVVISPDLGASKRTEAFARLYGARLLKLTKTRDRSTGEVRVGEEQLDIGGADVMIVDDIISTGGTVRAAAELVLKQGARGAIAVCVHGLFVGDSVQKLEKAGVKTIICTNTVPSKFSKVDVSDAIASHLKTLDD